MFSSLSASSSNVSTSSRSTSSATTKAFNAVQSQNWEERVPLTSKEEIEKKLASILTQVQQNQITYLDLTLASLGCFYELAHTLNGYDYTVGSLAVLSNGHLASGFDDNTIKLWDLATHSCHTILRGHTSGIWTLVALPNGQLASGSSDYTIKLWDLASHSCLSTLVGHTRGVKALIALPNGQLASGSDDNTIKLWDLASNSCLFTLQKHTSAVEALAVLPDGQLASGSWDHTIKLWDLASRSCLFTLQGHTNGVSALIALPNGQLASGSWDNTIKLWDLATHSFLSTLKGHTCFISALVVLPNGKLASGSWDHTIKLWDLASHSCLATLREHTREVLALAILPNGQLASGSWDHTVKLWESKTLLTQQLLSILNALKNNSSVTALDLSGHRDIIDDLIGLVMSIFTPDTSSGSKPNISLKAIDLRGTGVSKKSVKVLERAIQSHRLSIEVLADCPIEWIMIYFLIIFCRANRNSPFADSGLDLAKNSELGSFLGIPFGLFSRPRKNPSSANLSTSAPLLPG